jgi:hypothetical protein
MSGRLRLFLARHVDAVTMERLVEPILADIRIETAKADSRGRRWRSRWVRCAGTIALIKALGLHGWLELWSIGEWPREDRQAVARTLVYSAAVTAAAVPLLILPFLVRFPASRTSELAPYLVPQALPVALPVGLFIGLVYGFRSRIMSLRPRTALMLAAVLCSVASLVALSWVVPVSNHAFRVAALNDPFIPKGLPELTLGELRSRIGDNRLAAMSYHSRWALAATPIVLTAWAFLLIGRIPTRGRWPLGIVAIASCVAYWLLIDVGRVAVIYGKLPATAGAWLPNAAFLTAIALLSRRTAHGQSRITP